MVEKKEKAVCRPVRLKIGDKDVSGSLCKYGENLEFIPADEKQFKKAVNFLL